MMEPGRPSACARIGVLGTAVSVATAAALQAVDGVALKMMVDRWAVVHGEARERAFEAAFAVRQIEIGLASLLGVLFGLTLATFGVSIFLSRRFPAWLGWLALSASLGTVTADVAQAYTGFSALAMMISMPAGCAVLLWAIAVGALHVATRAAVGQPGERARRTGRIPVQEKVVGREEGPNCWLDERRDRRRGGTFTPIECEGVAPARRERAPPASAATSPTSRRPA